ncbi:MAG: S1/P1 Nuclease [Flavisolibacter sp.]|jgi:hypothetical protein|nr:S1/P1 Nuclease [Flavisolibacter sp.]
MHVTSPLSNACKGKIFLIILFSCCSLPCSAWGFYGHQRINYYAVFLLPPEMMLLYKPHINFLTEHAVDPDKRRYAVEEEGPRHYIDLDRYGAYPFDSLPRNWDDAVEKFSADTLQKHGIVPWWIMVMQRRLTAAFRDKDKNRILKISAELGHYISDAHVPLHTSSNHNGQYTNQRGIHGFWESRIPELLAETEWDFFLGKARYIENKEAFIWQRVLESAAASDSVLQLERKLNEQFPQDRKFAFEERNGKVIRQYSTAYTKAYDKLLNGMVERRMQLSIYSIACFWMSAWIDAGQPALSQAELAFSEQELVEFEKLNLAWKQRTMIGRKEED